MSTPQASLMSFNDYQTYLAAVNTNIDGGNYAGAFKALAQATVVLAGMPQEVISGQQTDRYRMLKELDGLRAAITAAQIAATGGGGMGIGLLSITRAR